MPRAKKSKKSSPIRHLPKEIIREIILNAILEFYHTEIPYVSLDTSTELWKCSHVCQLWREVTLSWPALWQKIEVFPWGFCSDNTSPLYILNTILSRSGKLPLTMRLNFLVGVERLRSVEKAVEEEMFLSLVDQGQRWQDVALRLPGYLDPHLQKLQGRIPMLESLNLDAWGNPGTELLSSIFSTAPNLRRIALKGNSIYVDEIDLPWSQITHIRCPNYWGDDVVRHRVPNLQLLPVQHYNFEGPVFRHDCITSLIIPNIDKNETTSALDNLILPSLSELQLWDWPDPIISQAIFSLIDRSQCHIDTLILPSSPRKEPTRSELESPFFAQLSSITTLSVPRYLGFAFNVALKKGSIFPNVQVLRLGYPFLLGREPHEKSESFIVDSVIKKLKSMGEKRHLGEIWFLNSGYGPDKDSIDTVRANLSKYKRLEEIGVQVGFTTKDNWEFE